MVRRCIALLLVVVVGGLLTNGGIPAAAQQIPEEVQRELDRRGLTPEEARERARQLGIDLSNPQQATRRARELGIPEARIQALLQAVQGGPQQRDSLMAVRRPTVTDSVVVTPQELLPEELPAQVTIRLPLRSEVSLRGVDVMLVSVRGDTVGAGQAEHVEGSLTNGVWEGEVGVPAGTRPQPLQVAARTIDMEGRTTLLRTTQSVTISSAAEDTTGAPAEPAEELSYFGYSTFENIPDAFRPNPVGPVDDGYLVGPNDELRLTVWGAAEFQYDLTVDREGRIYVPEVGQFTVAGKRLDELRTEVRNWLSQDYAGLTTEPPTVFMDLTVTRVRPVQVFVLGEVAQPGGYMVSSYSTVFNALYSVGGPLERGSLRNIRVVRNGEVMATVDLYDFLLQGYGSSTVQLQNNDYIFIPPRGKTVAITGAVKRPAYYEMKPGETVADLLEYAGGLEPQAYTKRLHIERIVPFDERTEASVARRVLDVNLQAVQNGDTSVTLADGDRVRVLSIREAQDPALATRIDAVSVTGAVFQPGRYELNGELRTVRDLIERADGLTGDAYRERAELIRVEDDLQESVRALDLAEVMDDEPTENVVLRPGDSLHVASVRTLEMQRTVRISGQVRRPGPYPYREDMTVRDLLFQGGGLEDDEFLKDVFLERADLFRVSPDGKTERVIPFHLGEALDGAGFADRPLQPEDEVRVYPAEVADLRDRFVVISGAVKEPGRFEFRDNLTLKDLILQAEGFTEKAWLKEVEITRIVSEKEDGGRAERIQVPLVGDGQEDQVSFSVRDTVQALERASNFQLHHRDRVYVRTDPNFQPQETVTVRGEVQYPGEYTLLRENETLSDLIARAGGVRPTGYPKGGRLYRGEEQVIVEMARAIQGDPGRDVILQPGDEIVVPPQPNTVAIRGNVANEGLIKYEAGRRVSYYLDRAGGALDDTRDIFLTQASGATFKVKTGWFRITPEVDDGAIIRVTKEPPKPEGEPVNIGNVIRDVTGILSSALTIIVLATRAFN